MIKIDRVRSVVTAGAFLASLCAQAGFASAQVAINGRGTTDAVCTDASGNVISRGGLNSCLGGGLNPSTGSGTGITITGGTGLTVNGAGITSDSAIKGSTLESTGNTTVGGTLTVTGPAQLNGGLTVGAGQVVDVGANRVQNVAGPIAGTDAANKDYVDGKLASSEQVLNGRINEAFKRIDQNTQGIAIAIAMGGLTLPNNKNFAIGANIGFYDGKQAAAASGAFRLDDTLTLTGGIGVGFDGGPVGGRVGIMAAF